MERTIQDLNFDLEKKSIFIIDSISSALITSILCKGLKISCIYECKSIEWRDLDFVSIYDFILKDMNIFDKKIINVPHPYFFNFKNRLDLRNKQKNFIKEVRKKITFDKDKVYFGSTSSSILLSLKNKVNFVLLDEGMSSQITRHSLLQKFENKKFLYLRDLISNFLMPFHFKKNHPQITLTNDKHNSIVKNLKFSDYNSKFSKKFFRTLNFKINEYQNNILCLIKGPPHISSEKMSFSKEELKIYIKYNLSEILKFKNKYKLNEKTCFWLKPHPSIGENSPLVRDLLKKLKNLNIISHIFSDFLENKIVSSIPAEIFLSNCNFNYLLSLDASSTVWNVCYDKKISVHLPLTSIIVFCKKTEPEKIIPLYMIQKNLNTINGSYVKIY